MSAINWCLLMVKPDPIGQRFGLLTVIGKGTPRRYPSGELRQRYKCRCDCGKVIQLPRGDFDRKKYGQKSCGKCASRRVSPYPYCTLGTRRAADLIGQRFGQLTVIERLYGELQNNSPVWMCRCDCGGMAKRSTEILRRGLPKSRNCDNRALHPDLNPHYPPTPEPYPVDAAAIVAQYLYMVRVGGDRVDHAIEDEKLEMLMRAAWIVVYRRSVGEIMNDMHIKRYLRKTLGYAAVRVYRMRKVEQGGGVAYMMNGNIQKGIAMTDRTSLIEVVSSNEQKTHPEFGLSTRKVKRIRFKRC